MALMIGIAVIPTAVIPAVLLLRSRSAADTRDTSRAFDCDTDAMKTGQAGEDPRDSTDLDRGNAATYRNLGLELR